ncbi:hypothetical protein SCHPADRAFT_947149 [Schizopora paradoxa]|uniref:DUF6532 domain-containing protein n=1 Tax=Schizopora paradoxa TaxID=27342 RepID=A0A0H2R1D6_9AGAM|nr:hypothetical protein SCHPADRAFT_947149 [Schizopora paradoxa]
MNDMSAAPDKNSSSKAPEGLESSNTKQDRTMTTSHVQRTQGNSSRRGGASLNSKGDASQIAEDGGHAELEGHGNVASAASVSKKKKSGEKPRGESASQTIEHEHRKTTSRGPQPSVSRVDGYEDHVEVEQDGDTALASASSAGKEAHVPALNSQSRSPSINREKAGATPRHRRRSVSRASRSSVGTRGNRSSVSPLKANNRVVNSSQQSSQTRRDHSKVLSNANRGRSTTRRGEDGSSQGVARRKLLPTEDNGPEHRRQVQERILSFTARKAGKSTLRSAQEIQAEKLLARAPEGQVVKSGAVYESQDDEGHILDDQVNEVTMDDGVFVAHEGNVSVLTEHRNKKPKHNIPSAEDLERHKNSLQTNENVNMSNSKTNKRFRSSDGTGYQLSTSNHGSKGVQQQQPAKRTKTNENVPGPSKPSQPRAGIIRNGWHDAPSYRPSAPARQSTTLSGSSSRPEGRPGGYAPASRHEVNPKASKDNGGKKRGQDAIEEEEGETFDIGIPLKPTKRRRGEPMSASVKKDRAIQRLLLPVDDAEDEEIEEGIEEEMPVGGRPPRGVRGARPDQIRFYTGEALALLTASRNSMRFYLFTDQPYATVESLTLHSRSFYSDACQDQYGSKWKELAPLYTRGMQKLLRDESWMLRHRIKSLAQGVVDRTYGLFPRPEDLRGYVNANAAELATQRFTQERVADLLGDDSLFLYAPTEHFEDRLPFTHVAIKRVVLDILFNPKSRSIPLASINYQSVNPIPVQCIAYASTAIRCALEEYKTGERVDRDFSENTYRGYYNKLLRNLINWRDCSSRSALLYDICQDMYLSGRARLRNNQDDDDTRPDGPFILSDNE